MNYMNFINKEIVKAKFRDVWIKISPNYVDDKLIVILLKKW